MYLLLSISTSNLSVVLDDEDGEKLKTIPLDELIKQKQEKDASGSDDSEHDQVDGGNRTAKAYTRNPKSQKLVDRLSDPIDGGEPNYRPRGNSNSVRDAVRIKPLSHSPHNSYER